MAECMSSKRPFDEVDGKFCLSWFMQNICWLRFIDLILCVFLAGGRLPKFARLSSIPNIRLETESEMSEIESESELSFQMQDTGEKLFITYSNLFQ